MASLGNDIKITGVSAYEINIQKQIIEAFRIFDENETGKIDIKNVNVIARALGCTPKKKEMKEFLQNVEDTSMPGFVKLEVLLPALKKIILKDEWKPASEDQLLQAFEFFDTKQTGRISPSFMERLLKDHGDKLEEKELEGFLLSFVDPAQNKIEYKKCYQKLVVPDVVDILDSRRKIMSEIKDD